VRPCRLASVVGIRRRVRRAPQSPSGLRDHVSRREAASLLGFASGFNVRRLEKLGRLHAVRGAMGQAWYARSEVLAVRSSLAAEDEGGGSRPADASPRRRWSDAELVLYLRGSRQGSEAGVDQAPATLRSVVDLVADTGISIARAERVYRFWLADPGPQGSKPEPDTSPAAGSGAGERRGQDRIERDRLIADLRDPDPAVRVRAFEKLRSRRARPKP
jgi:hypothetical protein